MYRVRYNKFSSISTGKGVREYLTKVLSRTGASTSEKKYLFHYTTAECFNSILKSGYLWLGSPKKMNDLLEAQIIQNAGLSNRLFFSSFSQTEESLAMYRMYAANPNGVMLVVPFSTAKRVLEVQEFQGDNLALPIVDTNLISDKTVRVKLYWAAVCYCSPGKNGIYTGSVYNGNISNPLNDRDLAGLIKLRGWKFEDEVRLCAISEKDLHGDKKLAIKLTDEILSEIRVFVCPGFDQAANADLYRAIKVKNLGINVELSEYCGLVDNYALGPSVVS